MKRGVLVSLAAAAAGLVTPAPALAQQPTIAFVDAAKAASLCPGLGLTGMVLGASRAQQDQTLARRLNNLPADFAPFTEAELDFTAWSDRLAGVTYRAASPDGDVNRAWAEALEDNLLSAGWTPLDSRDLASPLAFDGKLFKKRVEGPQGARTLLLEFDIPGALMLRCGDLDLFEIGQEESEGRLAPGTPRPVAPPTAPPAPLPKAADCDDPALLAAFETPNQVDESAPAFRAFIAGGEQIFARKRHGERLRAWLTWTLLGSGRVDQERIWDIEEAATPDDDAQTPLLQGLLGAMGGTVEAMQTGDAGKTCRSLVSVMAATAEKDEYDATRDARINQALEAEARRLRIAVD